MILRLTKICILIYLDGNFDNCVLRCKNGFVEIIYEIKKDISIVSKIL